MKVLGLLLAGFIIGSALFVGGAILGISSGREDATKMIQASCEDPAADTIINGVKYQCFTQKRLNEFTLWVLSHYKGA